MFLHFGAGLRGWDLALFCAEFYRQTHVWPGRLSALDPPPVAMVRRRELFLTPVRGLLSNISVVLEKI